jgi:formylglycine-generating enzyme required for sulfatase activity
VTTNYDRVLQWSNATARIATNSQATNLAELFAGSSADRPIVWHLHGHIDDPDSLILAPRQYDRLYREATDDKHPYAAARLQLRTLMGNHPLLFVGFGLQDEYVLTALTTVLEIFGGCLRPSYALLKAGDDRARALWDKHRIQVIEYADYGAPLVELLAEFARQVSARPADGDDLGTGPAVIPPAYVEWLTEQCADVTPFGMAPAEGRSVCLRQVYVPLVTRRAVADEDREPLRPAGKRGRRKRKQVARDVPDEAARPRLVLDLLGQRSLYVSGDPGTGKSTFCRWVAWLAATGEMPPFEVAATNDLQEQLPDALRGRLPVLVPLREFRDYLPAQPGRRALSAEQFQTALQRWLDQTRPGGLTWSDVAPHLAHGSLLLMLDGIDELPPSEGDGAAAWSPREAWLAGLTAAATGWLKRGNRLLATSRPYGLSPDQVRQLERVGLTETRLDPLPDAIQDLLAARWFVALPKTSAEGRGIAAAMLGQVRRLSGDVKALAANPLLLTAICIIYSDGKALPQDKHDLYHRIVNTALCSRYVRGANVIEAVRARLAAVALGMHTGQPHQPSRQSPAADVANEELDHILSAYMAATPETESGFRRALDAREDLLSRSGLLSQREADRASFYHLSFQEFLAAERLVLLNPSEDKLLDVFRARAPSSGWRPTLSFLFGSRVAQPGWQAGVDLLKRILATIDSANVAGSLGLALSAVDALEVLLGRELKLQEPLLDDFRKICLAAIEQEAELKARVELARMLGRVGDPRVVDDLSDPAAWVQVSAGTYRVGDAGVKKEYGERNALTPGTVTFADPFALSRFPVTNGQFRRFLDSGGYDNRSLWHQTGWRWREANKTCEPGLWRDAKWNGATQPVVGVSWWEADAFCRWAGCRLPTEREWEAAARGLQGWAHPWGDEWRAGICNSDEAQLGVTTPVGVFPGSTAVCGADDMAGNVWEWCTDLFDPTESDDPTAVRVVRGGSWYDPPRYCRSAVRDFSPPDYRGGFLGFRAART